MSLGNTQFEPQFIPFYDNQFIINLYQVHIEKIRKIREQMKKRYAPHWSPQFDDTEAEITCLLLFCFKPKKVIEFSPYCAWSTSIILDALAENKNDAILTSYDVIDSCLENLQPSNRWNFVKGDVQQQYANWNLSNMDYLFIDSDHSREFALHYVDNLLAPLLRECRNQNKQLPVSVHDVFHRVIASDEGQMVINFLHRNGIRYYTAACTKENYYELVQVKKALGIDEVIHKSCGRVELETQANSAIFFILP